MARGLNNKIRKRQAMQKIILNDDLLLRVHKKEKTATTRRGIKDYTLGPVVFVGSENKQELGPYTIHRLELVKFEDIDDCLAKIEGYKSAEELKSILVDIYGEIQNGEFFTVAYFN